MKWLLLIVAVGTRARERDTATLIGEALRDPTGSSRHLGDTAVRRAIVGAYGLDFRDFRGPKMKQTAEVLQGEQRALFVPD
ncbi:hypothetical protein [Bradyrhizobium sp. USDA 10063]